MPKYITKDEFDIAVAAVWSEIEYQNALPYRTDDEAKDPASFATLGRRYLRKLEDVWADNAGVKQPDGQVQVTEALDGLRKLAAIFTRGMIYSGVRHRIWT